MSIDKYIGEESHAQFDEASPFTKDDSRTPAVIHIPNVYRELFANHDAWGSVDDIPYTAANLTLVHQVYISAFWMENWYQPDLPTPATQFYNWPVVGASDISVRWDGPKFVRLNGLSPKTQTRPIHTMREAIELIVGSQRCVDVLQRCAKYAFTPQLAVRDWVSIDHEFRCFVCDNKLTAICSNDETVWEHGEAELLFRAQDLLSIMRYEDALPFQNCIMDVAFCHGRDDCVLEFNSFGAFANGSSGLFHWLEDAALLHGVGQDKVAVRLLGQII